MRLCWPLLLLAGCVAGEIDTSDADDATVGGLINAAPDTTHVNVLLVYASSGQFCTGTLIGSRTVLTAAHCLADPGAPGRVRGSVSVAPDVQPFSIVSERAHPAWDWVALRVSNGILTESMSQHDLALLTLDRPVTGIEPATLDALAPLREETITMVGFGRTGADESDHVRRSGTNVIAKVLASTFSTKGTDATHATADHGDSGGPAFVLRSGRQIVAGVASAGTGAQCSTFLGLVDCVMTRYARMDTSLDWIEANAADLYDGAHYDHTALPKLPPPSPISWSFGFPSLIAGDVPFELWVHASGAPMQRVELTVDGDLAAQTDAIGETELTWQPEITLDAGTHVLRLQAYASSGDMIGAYEKTLATTP